MSDQSKKPGKERKDKIEDLAQKPVSDKDAQTVKGGMTANKLAKK